MISKCMCIAPTEKHLNGKGSWSFNDDFARNAIIFGVDNSLSSDTDNLKK